MTGRAPAGDASAPKAGGAASRGAVRGGSSALATVGIALAAYALAAALVSGIASSTYGFFAVTDIGYYRSLAEKMALGLRPYSDFPVEYPPLAVLLVAIPQWTRAFYPYAFVAEMLLWGAAAAVAVALTAARALEGAARVVPPLAFAVGVAASGAILANRFDLAVAFAIAAAVGLLVHGRHSAAAALLGLGFALKLVPILLLPLVLVGARRRAAAAAAFAVAAIVPFLPFVGAPHLPRLFLFHAQRPLQFESVLATPLLLAHALGVADAGIATAYGSQMVVAPGAEAMAAISGPLQLIALGLTYGLVLRRRAALRPEHVGLPVLAVLLAFVAFGKVLSPQFLAWALPAAALLAPRHAAVAALFGATLCLTQVQFPALFEELIALQPVAVGIVALRNALLLATLALALVRLWRLPASDAASLA